MSLRYVLPFLLLAGCATVNTQRETPQRALSAEPIRTLLADAPIASADPATQLAQLATEAGTNPAQLNAAAHFAIREGNRLRSREPEAAAGFFASALELGLRALANSPTVSPDETTRFDTVNTALLQLITIEPDPQAPIRNLQTPLGPRTFDVASDFANTTASDDPFNRIVPAQLIRLSGFTYRMALPGFGVPLIGIRKFTEDGSEASTAASPVQILRHQGPLKGFYLPRGTFTPVTAIANLANNHITIELLNPKTTTTVSSPNGRAPLAADFTAPIALFFDRLNDLALGIRGLLRVDRQMDLAGLYMIEPYDPDRIPVVMVHGLSSSPLIWRNLINELSLDPVIRKNYQFWVVYYPSGIPTTASAYFLRERINAVRTEFDPNGNDRASRNLVTTGHSMGGVITRMNATAIGDRLWRSISKVPFDEAPLTPEDRALIEPRIFWEPIPHLKRSIYFSAPHRGATLADSNLANLGMRLIRFPADVFNYQKRILTTLASVLTLDADFSHLSNSIGSLSPRNPVFLALDGAPFKDHYTYHSVVGDRGRGDTPDSSDGIVGYWSSHLPNAASEIIVPTGHESFSHPNAIENTRQILRTHLAN